MGMISLPEMRTEYAKTFELFLRSATAVLAGVNIENDDAQLKSRLARTRHELSEQTRRLDSLRFGIQDFYSLAAAGIGPAVDWKILDDTESLVRIDTELCRQELRCISDLLDGDNVEHEKAGPGGWYIVARYPCGHATRWMNRTSDYVVVRLRRLTQEAQ